MKKFKAVIQGCIGILMLLLIWTVASKTGLFGKLDPDTAEMLFPDPLVVGKRFVEVLTSGYLLTNIWVSMKRVLVGFCIAVIIGLPIGIFMGRSQSFHNYINPIIRFVSPIPGVAWVPLAILWFGLGNNAAIFIIIMGSMSPIITNTYQGMQNVDSKLYQVLDIMEANWHQTIRYCVIPSILPYVMAGFKLGLGFAWRVVIAAEMVGVPRGMGYVLSVGRNTGDTAITLITIITLGIIMILMEVVLFGTLEKRMNKWKMWE
ncbi:MAG: ABC transporter permease [Lachnospiraceae bacterium]|nr:ABC transporter permease [Lachnospiraceae bacterium]